MGLAPQREQSAESRHPLDSTDILIDDIDLISRSYTFSFATRGQGMGEQRPRGEAMSSSSLADVLHVQESRAWAFIRIFHQ